MVLQNITGLTQNDFLLQLYMARIRLPLEHRHQHIKGFVGKLLRILTDGRQLRCGEHGVARIVKAEHLDLLRDADALSGRGIDHRLRDRVMLTQNDLRPFVPRRRLQKICKPVKLLVPAEILRLPSGRARSAAYPGQVPHRAFPVHSRDGAAPCCPDGECWCRHS